MSWKIADRPGYFGKKREAIFESFNRQHGEKNWRIAWEWGNLVLDRPEALQIYEDAYYEHFRLKPEILDWLINNYSNVYDTAQSNMESVFNYTLQETLSNHLHDIAIRRAVIRGGKWFLGNKILEVRSTNEDGKVLSPCKIPFHLPEMIYRGQTKYQGEPRDFTTNPPWWRRIGVQDSVEEFYQQNKVLQIAT